MPYNNIIIISIKVIIGVLFISSIGLLLFYKLYFLRNPIRNKNFDSNLLTSPANGKIIKILKSSDKEYIDIYKNNKKALDVFVADLGKNSKDKNTEIIMISIMMNIFNVHRQKAPYNSILLNQIHTDGLYLNAVKDSKNLNATLQNENNIMSFETINDKDTNNTIKFKIIQIAGLVARRIVPLINEGDKVKKGDVIGLIKLGSQVTIIFNANDVNILVKEGDIVIDGETLIAKLIE